MRIAESQQFIQQTGDVLARRDPRDGAGQDVIEHQGGNGQLGQVPSQSFLTIRYTPPRTNIEQLST